MSDTSADEALSALERDIELQRKKLLDLARRLRPGLTQDDLTQPHDFRELTESWHFQYEEGFLSGLLAAQLTLRRICRK